MGSGGCTADKEDVSTIGSGCGGPIDSLGGRCVKTGQENKNEEDQHEHANMKISKGYIQ